MSALKDTDQLDGIELRHDSVITHADANVIDGGFVWEVRVDDQVVATFDDKDGDGEDPAVQLRSELEAKVAALATRVAYIQALRDIADFLEWHPEVPVDKADFLGPSFYSLGSSPTPDELLKAIEALDANLEPAFHAPKDMVATRAFGPIRYQIRFPRALVCEERDVTVKEFVLPDTLAAREQKAA